MPCVAAYMAAASAPRVVVSKRRVSPHWVMRKPPLSMTRAEVASLLTSRSSSKASIRRMSSSINWGRVGISGGSASALVDELVEQHAGNHVERFKDAFAFVG